MFLLIHLLLGIQPEKSNLHNRSNKISKLSVIEHGATLGKNNIICENVIIRSNVTIGNNNWVGPNSILENNVTEPGLKEIYLQIIHQDGSILKVGDTVSVINYDNGGLEYTTIQEVDYKNTQINDCFIWDRGNVLLDGIYSFKFYMDGTLIGETERFMNWAKVLSAMPSEIFYIFGAIVAASFGIKISNIFKK